MKTFYFTLMIKQGGGIVVVHAEDYMAARRKMFDEYGDQWAFQHSSLDEVHPDDRTVRKEIH